MMDIISKEYQTPVNTVVVPKELQGKAFKVSFELLETGEDMTGQPTTGLGSMMVDCFKDVPPAQSESPQGEDADADKSADAWSVLRSYFEDVPVADSFADDFQIPDRKADMLLERPPVSFE